MLEMTGAGRPGFFLQLDRPFIQPAKPRSVKVDITDNG
jgi:hypothetical protein